MIDLEWSLCGTIKCEEETVCLVYLTPLTYKQANVAKNQGTNLDLSHEALQSHHSAILDTVSTHR